MGELQKELQRLSGTTLDAQGAANAWAGTTDLDLDLIGALNTEAGLTRPNWLELEGVLNYLAGTSGLGVNAAAAAITGVPAVASELLLETGDSLLTESGDILILEA